MPTATLRQGTVGPQRLRRITTFTPADIAALYPATGGVNPIGLQLLQTAPLPNTAETGDGLNTGGFRFNARNDTELNTHIAKFDLNITDRQTLYFRGNYQDDSYTQASAFPGTPSPTLLVKPEGFSAGHAWTLSNTLVNNLRAGLTPSGVHAEHRSGRKRPSTPFRLSTLKNYTAALARTSQSEHHGRSLWIKGSHTRRSERTSLHP